VVVALWLYIEKCDGDLVGDRECGWQLYTMSQGPGSAAIVVMDVP
jgi:hypothetical protein